MCCFFFNDTATTEIYTLSLHDALPIFVHAPRALRSPCIVGNATGGGQGAPSPYICCSNGRSGRMIMALKWLKRGDRKSTRLNSSHANISYAVFCLKKNRITLFLLINSS